MGLSYPKVLNLGHRYIATILQGENHAEEKIDGCCIPETKILTTDLVYKQAGDLKIGDSIVGFDDTTNAPKLRESIVTANVPIKKLCYKITTETREVIASYDHPWLVTKKQEHNSNTNSKKLWINTDRLKIGDKILSLPLFEKEETWEAGYLAGFYDGEGSLVTHKKARVLSVTQASGKEIDLVKSLLTKRGFNFRTDIRKRKDGYKEATSLILKDSWTEVMRFLGEIQPQRLLRNKKDFWIDAGMNSLPREEVIDIEEVGEKEVAGLSTTTHTYTAEGLLCHNSQFNFGRIGDKLIVHSRGADLNPEYPMGMFKIGVEYILSIKDLLVDGYFYHGEYLQKPKHNVLNYSRIPKNNIMIFDIEDKYGNPFDYGTKRQLAEDIGLETVPLIKSPVRAVDDIKSMLEVDSVLGGTKIEGIVIKNYMQLSPDGKYMVGKFVSEKFKEKMKVSVKEGSGKSMIDRLVEELKTEARWNKCIQHCREEGLLEDAPKDIGFLIKELIKDLEEEEGDYIKEKLYQYYIKEVRGRVIAGFPEFYKTLLLDRLIEKD